MRRALLAVALLLAAAAPPGQAGSADLAGRKIVLDPGHGGSDPGAVGFVTEKDVNLDVALRARDLLQQEGATVLMTRTCDCTVSLATRVAIANNNGADRFLSVHSNACGGCGGTGTETYYHSSLGSGSTDAALARVVQEEMVQHLQLRDRGVKQADFYVLRNTAMPAVLVELGFVDTRADADKLGSAAWRQEAARALLHAVQRHYGIAAHDPAPSDATPPSTSASLAGTPGDSGWWRSAVTVSLSASDGGSGVARTLARVDGGAWFQYGGPFGVGGEGSHRAEYHSVDNAGNQEGDKASPFAIDTVAPLTTHALAGLAGDAGWWRSAVSVSLGASDATSGVAGTTALRDGAAFPYAGPFAVAGDGRHALAWESRDVAGNVEARRSAALPIDATPPLTALEVGAPRHQGAHLYVSGATPLALAAADATSGVRGTAWAWRGAERGYDGAFTLGGPDGASTLSWRSEDVAGNLEAWRAQDLFLDTTPPILALAQPAEGAVLASLDPLLVEAEATDAGAGVARVEFRVDGALRASDAVAPYAWAWPVGDEALGGHVLEVAAFDHLGHATHVARNVTTVPTSAAGLQATAQRLQGLAEEPPAAVPPRLPVVGLVAEADPATGEYRVGVLLDGRFVGLEGEVPR